MLILVHATTVRQDITREVKNILQTGEKETFEGKELRYKKLFVFFWVIPLRLNFICRHFGTLCLFHLHRQVGMKGDWG